MAIRNYKFRMYPTKSQAEQLEIQFEFLRFLYNSALQERIDYYNKYKENLSYYAQSRHLPEIKKLFPEETKNIHSQVLQECLKTLDKAFSAFFRRLKNGENPGFPRFKKFKRFVSIKFPQVISDLSRGCIILRKLGNEKAKLKVSGFQKEFEFVLHRVMLGICKTVMIKKEPS